MSQLLVLKLYKSSELVQVKQFDTSQIVIGRSPESQFVIEDSNVSMLHAVIEQRGETYFVSDLGSDTGVVHNNKKVLEAEIKSGDILKIGNFEIHFFIGIPKVASPAPQAEVKKVQTPQADAKKTEFKNVENKITPKVQETLVIAKNVNAQDSDKEDEASPPPKIEKPPKVSKSQNIKVEAGSEQTPPKDKIISTAQKFSPNKKPSEALSKPIPKGKSTYAPDSEFDNIKQFIKPEKGTVVEVVVAWRERVISSHHFSSSSTVYIGSDSSCDIQVPVIGTSLRKHKLLKLDSMARVFITQEMDGEYVTSNQSVKSFKDMARNNQLEVSGSNFIVNVAQGDMALVKLAGGQLVIAIRYVSETPKPAAAPFFDLTASEVAGIIMAIVVASIFSLYMLVYAPEALTDLDDKMDEPLRKAVVTFKPPRPKQIVTAGEETKKTVEKQVVEIKELEKKAPPAPEKTGQSGKAGSVQKTEAKVEKKTELVQQKKQGGAVNTGASGASAKSDKPDPLKSGILGVFGKGGTQEKLNQVFSGSGELTGMAEQATGKSGFNEDRAGKSLGARTKESPGSGSGKQTIGVAGPITDGRGAGNFGFGSGSVGTKGSVNINIGGQEEAFVGTIDREAIRRVILDNISQIRNCYERLLNQKPDLFGKLVIEWDIEEKGRVKKARAISNSTGSSELATCVVTRLKTWRFPEPPDDQIARVTYPFVFAAK